ncbi:MAG TPA: hypothetical protein PLM07_18455 [Candidatus Rifleibacterium sp.]|nr:hypothetical protein [Candidatus Rifleibacterium sp.]HPT47865.1 hypothetical protein [Candidatus Rifleibacterium sp.]
MVDIRELDFICKVTRVYRKNIDLLIKLSDDHRVKSLDMLLNPQLVAESDFSEASFSVFDSHRVSFSLYALAIVHCYSLVENNRKKICLRLPGLSPEQAKDLSYIKKLNKILKLYKIDPKKISNYAVMEDFRLLNNAIKHDRYNLSTKVTTDQGITYDAMAIKKLYVENAQYLEEYLVDLYKKVTDITQGLSNK